MSVYKDSEQAEMLKWCSSMNILPDDIHVWKALDLQTASLLPEVCERATNLFVSCDKVTQPIICARLHRLNLYACTFSSLANLIVFSNLKILSLEGCSNVTSESLLNSLAACKQLTECTIYDCNLIEGSVITYILDRYTRLESLRLRGAHQRPYNLASILSCCTRRENLCLHTLVISNSTICNTVVCMLAACFPLLKQLHLSGSGSNLYNSDVDHLVRRCSQLTNLALEGYINLGNVALFSIALHLRLLQHLSIECCTNISNEGVIAIADGCARLESLNISYCVHITNEAVRQVRRKCMPLNNLGVAGCDQLTDEAFSGGASAALRVLNVSETNLTGSFYQHTSTVTELYCINCPHINHELVQHMVTYGSNVTALFLNATRLSVEELMCISTHVPFLERVRISHSAANDKVMRSFVKHCPRLRWMNVMGCIAVTADTVRELQQTRKMHIPM